MNKLYEAFLNILKAAMQGQRIDDMELSPEEWTELLKMAEKHTVLPMFFEVIHGTPALRNGAVPAFFYARQQVIRQVGTQAMKTSDFLDLYRRFQQNGIRPLVVKGLTCRVLYPWPDHRPSGDEDVLIPPEHYEACHRIMLEHGMYTEASEEEKENSYEIPYHKKGGLLYIELHKHLFPPQSEAYGHWGNFFTDVHQRAQAVDVQGTTIYSLNCTDNLFYLICHAFKHFLHSGFGIRQVCDIVMYANRYGNEIDWLQVWDNCRAIRAEKFAGALFEIGRKYLGFDLMKSQYPAYWLAMHVDEHAMLMDLLAGGIYGDSSMSRKHSSNMTLNAVAASNKGKKATASAWGSVFPAPKKLEGRYPYLKKHPYLVPVAWTDRILKYRKETKKMANNDAAEALKIGSQRVELLRTYGIIE